MKFLRLLPRSVLVFAAFIALAASTQAQIDFIMVSKSQEFLQTTNSAPAGNSAYNFQFTTEIQGTNVLSLATPTLNSHPGSGPSGNYGQDEEDGSWVIQQDFGMGGELETAYGVGDYNITAAGDTVNVNLSDETPRFTAVPFATLSGGTISGGVLTWNVSQSLTLTLSDPNPGGTAGIDHIAMSIWGNGIDRGVEAFGNTTQSITILGSGANNTFIAGSTYTVEMEFVNISGGSGISTFDTSGALDGVEYVGYYGRFTTFTIQAIPEPSTYAAVFGALALAGVMVQRRRRVA